MSAEAILNYIFASIGLAIAAAYTYLGRAKANTGQVEAETNRENLVTTFAATFNTDKTYLLQQNVDLNKSVSEEQGRHKESEKNSAMRIAALEVQVKDMETTLKTQKQESDASSEAYEKRISELEAEQKKLHDTINTLNETVAARDETIALQDKALAGLHDEVRKLSELVAPFIATQIAAVPIPNETNVAAAAESSQHENPK